MSFQAVSEGMYSSKYCVTVHATCEDCGKLVILHIPEPEWLAWTQQDKLIQHAMPSVSEDDRELLITGTCGECFEELFSDIEEDPEERTDAYQK